jgi:hypothetical protein
MAKELPYFKFEPNQWENGNIQICSRDDKGLFIDLCSMYWSRLGDVPLKLAINKLCGGNATAFDSLIRENIFTVIDGLICIDYLNEQLNNFDETSKINSKNAKEGWEKRRKQKEESERNATASNPQCENDAIREEKKREEKRREEVYRKFAHLSLSIEEFNKLDLLFHKHDIENILDKIENYAKNKSYISLYLTALNWLKRDCIPKDTATIKTKFEDMTSEEQFKYLQDRKAQLTSEA